MLAGLLYRCQCCRVHTWLSNDLVETWVEALQPGAGLTQLLSAAAGVRPLWRPHSWKGVSLCWLPQAVDDVPPLHAHGMVHVHKREGGPGILGGGQDAAHKPGVGSTGQVHCRPKAAREVSGTSPQGRVDF